jgi:uncharacterized protein
MDPLTVEDAMQLLAEAPVAHIGFLAEGSPYVTPMSFVVDGQRILFRTTGGKKLEALRRDPHVCIEVTRFDPETGNWASAIVIGMASESEDQRSGELAVEMLYEKYGQLMGDPLSRGGLQPMAGLPHVIEVSIEEITGMSSGMNLSPRTRPGRL